MIVLSYVQADNWPDIHMVRDGSTDTLCGVDLDSAVPDATSTPAPSSEGASGRSYCQACADRAAQLDPEDEED